MKRSGVAIETEKLLWAFNEEKMTGREKFFFFFLWRKQKCDDKDSLCVVRAAAWIRSKRMLCNACARNVVMNGVGDRVVRNVRRAYWQYAFEGSEKTLQDCAGLFFVVSCTTPLIFGCVYSSVVSLSSSSSLLSSSLQKRDNWKTARNIPRLYRRIWWKLKSKIWKKTNENCAEIWFLFQDNYV
jgi:hypothetical protein